MRKKLAKQIRKEWTTKEEKDQERVILKSEKRKDFQKRQDSQLYQMLLVDYDEDEKLTAGFSDKKVIGKPKNNCVVQLVESELSERK